MSSYAPPVKQGGYREIWKIAYPLILTNASHTVMQFVDRKFLSMNSTEDVAAALPGGILCFTMFTFFMATTGFTNAIVSQYNGNGDKKSCARAPWAGFYFALISGIVCAFILIYPGRFFINLAGHGELIQARELEYFNTLMPSGGFIFTSVAFCAFFSGRGKTWYVAIIHFSTSALNILLDYILIFGKFGAPALGITGAGLGTTLACVFGLLLSFIFFIFQNQKEYPTRSSCAPNFADLKRLLSFGAPTGVEVFFSVSGFAFVTFLIGTLGQAPLAANTIAVSINMIAFLPLLGMSEATGIVVGKYIGMGSPEISEKAAYRSWKMSTLYMLAMCAFYLIFPEDLFEFFSPAKGDSSFAEVLQYGRAVLTCAAVFNFFNVTRFIFLGALSGAGDTKVPMFIVIACAWGILAPGGAILTLALKMSIVAVWVFIAFHIFTLSSLIFLRFRSGKWKKIDLIGRKKVADKKPLPAEFLETEAETPHLR